MLLAIVVLIPGYSIQAQEFRAVITGQVTDPSGAVIKNVTVTVVNNASGTSYTNETTDKGVYYIPYVLPGTYTVTALATGFKIAVQDNVLLTASQSYAQNFKLDLGPVSETVEVTGAPPEIETASGSGGTVIDERELESVPLNGSQVYMLIGTTPGSQYTTTSFGPGVGNSGTRGWDVTNSYTLGGGIVGMNQFTLNGTNITQQSNGAAGSWNVAPNLAAVEEVNVMTTTYDARYSRTSGGTVNVVTKGGSNAFHGSQDEAYEGALMNADTFQNNLAGRPRNGMVQNQFHTAVGGPILRNKLFFFFGFEGYRESLAGVIKTHVPPAYLRPGYNGNDGVDFGLVGAMDPSEFPTGLPIFEPGTAYCLDGGPVDSCNDNHVAEAPFPGNTIPAALINSTGAALLKYAPLPNISSAQNLASGDNYLGATPDLYGYNQPLARVDYNLTDKTKLYSFFEWQKGHEFRTNNGLSGVAANGNINWIRENWAATQDITHVFSATLLGDFKFSFTRYWTATPDGDIAAAVNPSTVGLNMPLPPTTSQEDLPEITVGDNWNSGIIGGGTVFGNQPGQDVWNNIGFDTDVTKTWGSHNLHLGGTIYEFQYADPGDFGSANGNFGFGSGFTQYNPHNTGCYPATPGGGNSNNCTSSSVANGSGLASLLLGYPTGGSIAWNNTIFEGQPVFGIYAQDDWRVNHRLTLNIGIRYDVQRGLRERHNHLNRGLCLTCVSPITNDSTYQANIANISNNTAWAAAGITAPSTVYGGIQFAGDPGQSRDAYDTDWGNVGPRLGFAFALDPKTVVRGGFGMMYSFGLESGSSAGQTQSTGYIDSLDGNNPTSYFQGGSPFPGGLDKPEGNSLGLLTAVGSCCPQLDFPDRKIPREKMFSVGVQHEFPGKIVLDARYAANYSSKLRTFLWVNGTATLAAEKAAVSNPEIWDQQVPNPYYGVASMIPGGCGQGTTVEAIDLILPLSQFCSAGGASLVGEYNAPLGHNWYNGLEVKATRRVQGTGGKGLTFQISYTRSKTINGDGYQNGWPNQDAKQQHWIAGTDRPNVLGITDVWDLPVGKNALLFSNPSRPLGLIINNWTLSSVVAAQSGTPVGLDSGEYYSCSHSFAPDGGASVGKGRWFYTNESCWQNIPQWGNADLPGVTGQIRTPQMANFDFSLQKTTPIREAVNFVLRLDAFNAFNSVLFPGPNTNPGAGPAIYTQGNGWSGFGTVNEVQQNFPRVLQVSGKISF